MVNVFLFQILILHAFLKIFAPNLAQLQTCARLSVANMMQTKMFNVPMSPTPVTTERIVPTTLAIPKLVCAYMFKDQIVDQFAKLLSIALNGELIKNFLKIASNLSVTKLKDLVFQSMFLISQNAQFQIATKFAQIPSVNLSLALMTKTKKSFVLPTQAKTLIAMITMNALPIPAMLILVASTHSFLALPAINAHNEKMQHALLGVLLWVIVSQSLAI
jgi:hypothetical protein